MEKEKEPVGWVYLIPLALMFLICSPMIAIEVDAHNIGGNNWARAYLTFLETPPPANDIAAGGNKFAMLPTIWGYERIKCNGNGPLRCWKKK